MPVSPKIVTIFGGSGFVGRYIARRLAKDGWRVRVAIRRPNEAMFVRTYGTVGQVEPILTNIRDEASTKAAIAGADAVVNCVGIGQQSGKQRFDAVQHQGAARIARLAAEAKVGQLVQISALGADPESDSDYARSKAEGEVAVLAAFPKAIILRPSIIFGPEDAFFNRFAKLAQLTPVIPLVGAETRFQPVYVDDVAAAAVKGVKGEIAAGTYELGGPKVQTFRQLMSTMLGVVHRKRMLVNLPFWIARIDAWFLDIGAAATGGLITNKILTRDQVRLLANDNVVSEGAKTLADIGIEPTPMEAILESYLYCHRPSGQYDAIKDSAKNLRKAI
ncbi:MAG: complex I NDUFA9 subunit family protein [Rhodobacterales bacterium]|jgi:uncharacterized protein YbjT (DUF2867 family)|nr:complex I NDUFA9 subunit family protein [Pseudomonadota bacterium]NQW12664.1 complex I NDUFA9 subunit family protein [Rhodobacter sp.]